MEKETKKCPYCGEEILAVAKKCKHCGEWLEPKEMKVCPVCGETMDATLKTCPHCNEPIHLDKPQHNPVDPLENEDKSNVADDGHSLYCKNCMKALSIEAESCPYCGDENPFYFKEIKKIKSRTIGGSFFVAAAFLYILIEFTGPIKGLSPWIGFIIAGIAIFTLSIIILTFVSPFVKQYFIEGYKDKIQNLYNENGYSEAIERWETKAEEIS